MSARLQQGAPGTTRDQAEQLRQDIRQSVREHIQAAAAQSHDPATRAKLEAALQQMPVPPLPPHPEVVTINKDGKTVRISTDAGGPTVATQGTPPQIPDLPDNIVYVSLGFFIMLAFIAVGWPLARAFGRRMDRQTAAGGAPARAFPTDVSDRIERIEHAVEAVAIEVERISEGQRFTTRLLSEMRPDALPAGPAGGAAAGADRRG